MQYQRDLLSHVHEVCRLHWRRRGHPDVEIKEEESATFAYLIVSYTDGPWPRKELVGVCEGHVDDVVLRDFRALTGDRRAEMVFRGNASPAIAQLAKDNDIWLRPFTAYQRDLWDATEYLHTQNALLTSDPEYPLPLYVDKNWAPLGDPNPAAYTALPQILEWLSTDGPRFVLVLGDFGTGKTFLLRAIADALSSDENLIPVMVTMRDLEKGRSLDELLAQHMARAREDPFPTSAFRYLLREGRIALLFDGFDELALRTSYERVPQHFATLREAAAGSAKVVVTSRHQYFATDQSVRNALGDEVHRMQGSRIIRLLPLRSAQRRELVVKTFDDSLKADEFIEAMRNVPNLLDLATNPRMLAFMIGWYKRGILTRSTLVQSADQPMTAGTLYELLLTTWMDYEVKRQVVHGGMTPLSVRQRMGALRETAMRMWRSGQRKLSLTDLGDVADRIADLARLEMRPGEAVHAVGSSTVLIRDEDGDFSFIHQSVMEWFVADAARDALAARTVDRLLADKEMTGPMVDFWCDLSGSADVTAWARDMTAHAWTPGPAAKANAALILQRQNVQAAAVNLAGEDLRGRDLSSQDFTDANLAGADLSGAVLPVDMRRADLRGAKLVDARLVGSDLTDADLSEADLRGARLTGADLTRARLTDTNLTRAVLIGAKVDPAQLKRANAVGAALPGVELQPQLMVSSAVTALAGLPGHLLASGHADGTVRIHDVKACMTVRIIPAHSGPVTALAASRNGWIASGGDRSIRMWNSANGQAVGHVFEQRRNIVGIAIEPRARWVASIDGARIRVWSSTSGSEWTQKTTGPVLALAAHPEDGSLLSVGESVRQWKDGDLIGTWDVPEVVGRAVGLVAGDAKGSFWICGTEGVVRIVDGAVEWSQAGEYTSILGSADSPWLTLVGEKIIVHSVTTHRETTIDRRVSRVCAVDPDGDWLAIQHFSHLQVRSPWDGEAVGTIGTRQNVVTSLAAGSGGRLVVVGNANGAGTWDLSTGHFARASGVKGTSVTIDQVSGRVACGQAGGVLVVDGVPVRLNSVENVRDLAFEPSGRWLAAATGQGVLMVDTRSDRIVRYRLEELGFEALTFDPEGRWLAAVSGRGDIHFWDARPRRLNPSGHQHTYAPRLGASVVVAIPHLAWVAIGGPGSVITWNSSTRELELSYELPMGYATALVAAPDGSWLGAGNEYGSVRVWDVTTQEERFTIQAHADGIAAITVDPVEGRWFATAGQDGLVRVWAAGTGLLLATLLSSNDGWAIVLPDGRYKISGNPREVWWTSGLCRFDASDVNDLAPYLPSMPWIPEDEAIDLRG